MRESERGALPSFLAAHLTRISEALQADRRIAGLAVGGSYISESLDEFSDLDLVVFVESDSYAAVLRERPAIAASLGQLLACFTGDHVGEPRLLICLYEDPLVHVDLKFVDVDAPGDRVEDPVVVWDRDARVRRAMARTPTKYPEPDSAWIEDRFWVWVHYAAAKVGRGELFEVLDHLGFIRSRVLGPMGLQQAGARPAGVRRVETIAPRFAEQLRGTVASYSAADCCRALRETIALYRSLRAAVPADRRAEDAAMSYLAQIERRVSRTNPSTRQ